MPTRTFPSCWWMPIAALFPDEPEPPELEPPEPPDEEPAGAVGTKVAVGLAMQELAATLAAETAVGALLLIVALPLKLQA